MPGNRTATGLLLIVALAAVGALLLTVPPWIATQLETVSRAGPSWTYVYLGLVGLGAAMLLASTVLILGRLWQRSRAKRERRARGAKSPSQLSRAERAREVADNLAVVRDLKDELAAEDPLRRELEPLSGKVAEKQESQKLEIVAFGAISSGKSSLLNALAGRDVFPTDPKGGTTLQRNEIPWPGVDHVYLVDTPGLGEVDGAEKAEVSAESARDADLVLVVVDGPLRDWEFQLIRRLGDMEKRVLICLNKEDWYGAAERDRLLEQIREQVRAFVHPEDIVVVRSRPTRRTRVRVPPDGSQLEETVDVPVDIRPLAERMLAIVRRDGPDLLLANLLLQSRGLVEEARERVRASLDRKAWEVVERYMWGAGGAAALSPFPLLDLAAGCAISTKMVVDLARVYRQEVDLDTAVRLLAQLGKNLVAILGISAATPAVTAAVASLLKTVPGVGTLAGGVLQGVTQAVITRWIGAVFVQYFRSEMHTPAEGLTGLARREWDRITKVDQLRQLVLAARARISPQASGGGPGTSGGREILDGKRNDSP